MSNKLKRIIVSTQLKPEELKVVRLFCMKTGVKTSHMLRALIRFSLDKYEKADPMKLLSMARKGDYENGSK